MKHSRCLGTRLTLGVSILLVACGPTENIRVAFPPSGTERPMVHTREWKLSSPEIGEEGGIRLQYAGEDQKAQTYAVQFLHDSRPPEAIMQQHQAEIESRCAQTSVEIIERFPNALLYERQGKQCRSGADEYGLTKIIQREEEPAQRMIDPEANRIRINYTAQAGSLSEEARAQWIQALTVAQPWKVGHEEEVRRQFHLIEFIPEGETVHNWSRLYSLHQMPVDSQKLSPRAWMQKLRRQMEARCPDTQWKVIQEEPNEMVYEWWITQCDPRPAQHELARILDGDQIRVRFAYVEKGDRLPEDRRDAVLKALKESEIVRE